MSITERKHDMSKWFTPEGIREVIALPPKERIPFIINTVIPGLVSPTYRIDRNVFGDRENSLMVSFKVGDETFKPFATLNDSVVLFGDVRISWHTYTEVVKYSELPEDEQGLIRDAWLYLVALQSGIHNLAVKQKDIVAGWMLNTASRYLINVLEDYAPFKQSDVATIKFVGDLKHKDLYTEVVNYIIDNVKYSVTSYHFKCNGAYCLQADALLTEFIHYAGDDAVDQAIYGRFGTLPGDDQKRISRDIKAILLVKCLDDEYIEPKIKEELNAIVSRHNFRAMKEDIDSISKDAYDILEHTLW